VLALSRTLCASAGRCIHNRASGRGWKSGCAGSRRRTGWAATPSFIMFLHHALDRTGRGVRDLDHLDDRALERLSAGTGVPVEQLRDMQTGLAMARMTERIQGWLESEEGRAALDQLRVSLMHMAAGQKRTAATGSAVVQSRRKLVCGA